jgi:heat shock protein HtpX
MSAADGRRISKTLAPLYLVNTRQSAGFSSIFSTHPPLEHRISILRDMAGAGFVDYEDAFRSVVGRGKHCINDAFLQAQPALKKRAPSPKESEQDNIDLGREALDVVDRAANYLIFGCPCGVRLKLPPDLSRDEIKCPRCGRMNEVPHAVAVSAMGAMRAELEGAIHAGVSAASEGRQGDGRSRQAAGAHQPRRAAEPEAVISYQRKSSVWESFRCPCEATIQLSPSFTAQFASCRNCGRHIRVIPVGEAADDD